MAPLPARTGSAAAAELSQSLQTEQRAAPGKVEAPWNALITELVRTSLPEVYEDTRDWGQTKRVFDGLKVSFDGLKIKTKRRKKEVPHGTWTRYRISPVDPDEELFVSIGNVRLTENKRLAFEASCTAKVRVTARLSQYNYGVQLASFSTEANARVRLRLKFEVGWEIDHSGLVPAVALKPKVTEVTLDLLELRLYKISKLDGPLVRELGGALRNTIEEALADRREKITRHVNRQIAKHDDRLRLSLERFAAYLDDLI